VGCAVKWGVRLSGVRGFLRFSKVVSVQSGLGFVFFEIRQVYIIIFRIAGLMQSKGLLACLNIGTTRRLSRGERVNL
jgi:hypothetical protein